MKEVANLQVSKSVSKKIRWISEVKKEKKMQKLETWQLGNPYLYGLQTTRPLEEGKKM